MLIPGSLLQQRYEIEVLLGQGGFGAVYRARHKDLNRLCAIKELFQFHDANYVTRFRNEAEVLAKLDHPALPQVTDYFSENQGYYLVMEYISGQNLDEYLDNQTDGRLNQAAALHIIGPILDALAYLHGQQPPVIHRDIKDSNIRITEKGAVYLVDFGIAKAYDPTMPTTTLARAVTPGFSPYEQYGASATDARSDIYALGATLYTMLTGEVPPEAVQRVRNDPLKLPSSLNPAVSPTVQRIILQMLAVWSDDRYPDVAAVRHDLDQVHHAVSDAVPASSVPRPSARRVAQRTLLPSDPLIKGDVAPSSGAAESAPAPMPESASSVSDTTLRQSLLDELLAPPPYLASSLNNTPVPVRPFPVWLDLLMHPAMLAAILGIVVLCGGVSLLFGGKGNAATVTPTLSATQGSIVAAAERTATPSPTAIPTALPTLTVMPSPTFSPSVAGSIAPTEAYTGTLPLDLMLSGQNLDRVRSASLVATGRTPIPLTVLELAPARLTLRLSALPEPLGGVVRYTLLLDNQPQATTVVTLRDFLETRTVRGVRPAYAYTGRLLNSDPARATMRDQPGGVDSPLLVLGNDDQIEVLRDDVAGWYQARIRLSSNPALIGRVAWVEYWLVDDVGVPTAPTVMVTPTPAATVTPVTLVPPPAPPAPPTATVTPTPVATVTPVLPTTTSAPPTATRELPTATLEPTAMPEPPTVAPRPTRVPTPRPTRVPAPPPAEPTLPMPVLP